MGKQRRAFGWLRKLPSGRWQASYTGPDDQRHTAPHTFDTKLDGEMWLGQESRLISEDRWTSPAVREVAKHDRGLTFREVAEQYLDAKELKPRTAYDYRRLLDRLILPDLGDIAVRDITAKTIATFYGRLDKGTPTQRARTYELTRAVLNYAVELSLIEKNPANLSGAGGVKRAHKIKPASLAELEAITAAMPPRYQLAVLLAAWCAMRYGEIAELRRKDIVLTYDEAGELTGGKVTVERGVTWPESASKPVVGTPKSEAGVRDVAIPPHLLKMVEDHLRDHTGSGKVALLFPNRQGMQTHHATFHKPFRRACVAAGRPDFHFHDLRHTGAVLAAQAGATLAELMARLGHSTPAAAMRYQHVSKDRDTVIAALLTQIVENHSQIQKAKLTS